ncbi:MAG: YkgJ family cysteine cluster protein [Candidatus Bathyarchaeia archaeon]
MRVVPWSLVSSWRCNACGICCRRYDVVLKFPEWLNIVKTFGVEYTAPSISKFFLRRRADGSCVFLYKTFTKAFCGLQNMKPQACKLWPFKVLDKPKYGDSNHAVYHYGNRRLFIYVDSACKGLRYGMPTQEFAYSVIPEFVEIAFGVRRKQYKTTAIL